MECFACLSISSSLVEEALICRVRESIHIKLFIWISYRHCFDRRCQAMMGMLECYTYDAFRCCMSHRLSHIVLCWLCMRYTSISFQILICLLSPDGHHQLVNICHNFSKYLYIRLNGIVIFRHLFIWISAKLICIYTHVILCIICANGILLLLAVWHIISLRTHTCFKL